MSLSLDQSPDAEFLRFIARFAGVSTGSASSGPIRVRLGKTNELYQVNTIAKYFARQADREAELCGVDAFEKAQISMWLDFASGIAKCPPQASATHWKVLETTLQSKTYFAANRVTLADGALFWVLYDAVRKFTAAQRAEYANLVRWFDQIQHTVGVRGFRDLEVVDLGRKQYALTV
jgi:glutathione S-transferase|uniref:GST C-terminal domain-containing protein n=1 Tax=Globisporangium ultimum (strain ATCC 200006 / CBS 805.95 / DAOM BR144) TaxID=431595 RepID=K3WMT3_GLOUD